MCPHKPEWLRDNINTIKKKAKDATDQYEEGNYAYLSGILLSHIESAYRYINKLEQYANNLERELDQ
jgi:hypothetical protein